jgi:hypothetical protein
MAGERIRKNATVEIGIIKMTIEEIIKSIKRIENEITLAKFLSELNVSKNDRVVIYDVLENMVFDSDEPNLFAYYEYWVLLEETVCRVSDVTENGKRTIFIFMDF